MPGSQAVLFVSGDGGWNRGVVGHGGRAGDHDALVVGIYIGHYLGAVATASEPCSYSAAAFEALSQWLQETLGFPSCVTPCSCNIVSGIDYLAEVESSRAIGRPG